MREQEQAVLARGRFFAQVDRLVNEVSMSQDNPVQAHVGRAYTPPDGELPGLHGPLELCGDWSWRPENQVKDPGYEFTAEEVAAVNEMWMGFGAFIPETEAFQRRMMTLAVPPRPWLVPAYDGRDLHARPDRIGPRA